VKSVTIVTVPSPPPRVAPRVRVAVLVALVLVGIAPRAAALASGRSLWIDEAMLALNLVNRTPAELLAPLDWNQGAPVGFLMASKGAVALFGGSEWALRLVPFLASCAGLIGFAWVARRLLPPGAAVLALALFALSPHLVGYAGECKQYASDAAVAVGLLALALGLLEGKGGRRWLALAAGGAVAVWCAHPAAFVLGGIGTALVARALAARDRGRTIAALAVIGCWLASFAACYALCLRYLSANAYLTGYWTDHFLPANAGALTWLVDHLIALFTVPGGFGGGAVPLGGFAAVLALLGLRELARERWPVAVALLVPVTLVLAASALHKYPFGGRLLLFLVPTAGLLVARGAWALFEAARAKNAFAAGAVLALLVGASAWQTLDALRKPPRHEQLGSVLNDVRSDLRPGDSVYVYYGAVPAFAFYTRDRALPVPVALGAEHRGNPAGYRAELAALRGRVWVIVSHTHAHEETALRTMLDGRGRCERSVTRPGAAAWLYALE
jgi:hypothetical protein